MRFKTELRQTLAHFQHKSIDKRKKILEEIHQVKKIQNI